MPAWQRWGTLHRGCFQVAAMGGARSCMLLAEPYVARLAAMWEARSRMLLPRNPTLPAMGGARSCMLLAEPYIARLAAMWEARSWMLLPRNPTLPAMGNARSWMLLGTVRCQVGSDVGSSIVDVSRNPTLPAMGSPRSWMLLGTVPYQVGSDVGSSIVDASRNRTLPGWQRWGKFDRGCCRKGETFNWHTWVLLPFDRQTRSAEKKPGHQKGSPGNNYQYHLRYMTLE